MELALRFIQRCLDFLDLKESVRVLSISIGTF